MLFVLIEKERKKGVNGVSLLGGADLYCCAAYCCCFVAVVVSPVVEELVAIACFVSVVVYVIGPRQWSRRRRKRSEGKRKERSRLERGRESWHRRWLDTVLQWRKLLVWRFS